MYMHLRGGSRPFQNGARFISENIFLEISKDTDTYFKAKITRHGKKKNDKDETANVLLNVICSYPSIT
jgi:hypothetical protein